MRGAAWICEIGCMRSTRSENKAGIRRRRDAGEVEVILDEYAKSGLTQRVFAREIGIGVSTLQYWLRRKALSGLQRQRRETGSEQTSPEVSLLEVDLADIAGRGSVGEERYEIEWASGMRLRVPRGFRQEELRTLLGMVKEVA